MKTKIVSISIILLLYIITYSIVYSLDGFLYVVNIDIENSTDETIYDRSYININSKVLLDYNYIQPDGDDIYLTNYNDTIKKINVNTLSGTNSTWILDYGTCTANSIVGYKMYIGSNTATRNQYWIGSTDDDCYILDDNSLDFSGTDSFELSANINTLILPNSGSQNAIYDKYMYSLIVSGTPYYSFVIYESLLSGTQSAYPSTHSGCDEGGSMPSGLYDNSDSTYIQANGVTCTSWCQINDIELDNIMSINKITTRLRAKETFNGSQKIQPMIKNNDGTLNGVDHNIDTTWTWYSDDFDNAPSGNEWTFNDLENLELGIKLTRVGDNALCSEAYIVIYGYFRSSPKYANIPCIKNTEYNLTAIYNSGTISLSSSGTSSGLISTNGIASGTNSHNISCLDFNGHIDNLMLSKSGTLAYFDFEPISINAGTISDLSGNNFNILYSLGTSSLTTDLSGIQSTEEVMTSPRDIVDLTTDIDTIDDWSLSEDSRMGEDSPFFPIVVMFDNLMNMGIMTTWYFIYCGSLILILLYSHRIFKNAWIVFSCTFIVSLIFWSLGPVPMWVLFVHAISGIFIITTQTNVRGFR